MPSNLHIVAVSEAQIDLAWTDNGEESEFRVERSPDGSTNWMEIGAVGADVTSYSDSGLSQDTTYYYRVRAYRHVDQYSGYSNVAEGTTIGTVPAPPDVNHPPYEPPEPSPEDGATEQSSDVDLRWTGGDPPGGCRPRRIWILFLRLVEVLVLPTYLTRLKTPSCCLVNLARLTGKGGIDA